VSIHFELLERHHDRSSFSSGAAELDSWFKTRASQDQKRNICQVIVAVDAEGVAGFYSLSMFSLQLDTIREKLARKLPKYGELPAALIGRLARHERLHGRGLGDLLLADAILRVLAATQQIASYAIVVDAKDDAAIAFYIRHGFIQFPDSPSRLFLPISTARAALTKA